MSTVNILKVPYDYQILAKNGGIVLDAYNDGTLHAATPGTVTVYGDLNVIGDTTYVSTTNTNVVDNIIFLNSGESNGYVTRGYAGLAISRGDLSTLTNAATLLYNDTFYWTTGTISTSTRGIWEFSRGDGVSLQSSAIRINGIRMGAGSRLNIFGQENPNSVLNVSGTIDYENNVVDDDDIPNKRYVDQRVYSGTDLAKRLVVGGTSVTLKDPGVLITDPYYENPAEVEIALGTSTNVVFSLRQTNAAIQGLQILDTNISVQSGRASNNLRITPYTTGTVEIASALSLANINPPNVKPLHTNVYSTSTVGGGGTGIYFVNTQQADELISRRRAIIYSLIF